MINSKVTLKVTGFSQIVNVTHRMSLFTSNIADHLVTADTVRNLKAVCQMEQRFVNKKGTQKQILYFDSCPFCLKKNSFLSFRVFRLLSSSLLNMTVVFIDSIEHDLWDSSGVSCRTRKLTRNFESHPLFYPLRYVSNWIWRNDYWRWFPTLLSDNHLEVTGSILTEGE